jgi:hypothetical protein
MLKALVFTLFVATFLVSGISLAPAGQTTAQPQPSQDISLVRTETFTVEYMTILPMDDASIQTKQADRAKKTDLEVKPNS